MTLGLFLAPPRKAEALAPFLDGRIDLHVRAIATYDSNVFTNTNEEDDLYFTLNPEIEYTRTAGVLNLGVQTGVELIRFIDFTNQDTEDFYGVLTLSYPNRPGVNPRYLSFDLGWRQKSDVNENLGTRTRSEIFSTGLTFRNNLSARFGYRVMGSFSNEQFKREDFSELDIGVIGADAIYIYSDQLEAFVGYRYRNSQTGGLTDTGLSIDDHLLQAGVEGQLSAKVVGRASVGIQNRSFSNELGDSVRPYGMASLDWTPRERSVITLHAENDFDVAANDRSVDRSSIHLSLDQEIYAGLSVEPRLSYAKVRLRRADGRTRDDDRYGVGVGLTYELAAGATVGLRLTYLKRQSTEEFFDYGRHMVDLSGAISF